MSTPISEPIRVLILTASMGDGHNTAARNIRDALVAEGANSVEVLVADPYTRTNPIVNHLMQSGYTIAINQYPRAWKILFQLLSRRGAMEMMGPILAGLTSAVRGLISEFQPHIIASTYPVFSFLIAKIRKSDNTVTAPFYTIITDSTHIHPTWYRCPCDGSIVADEVTASVLREGGVPPEKIHILGFPVGLEFEKLTPIAAPTHEPWRILFCPSGTETRALATLQHLVKIKNATIDVVTGRRKTIYDTLMNAKLPDHGSLTGWTDKMSELMSSHHVFIGKAGGATVQEAISAQIPFLVSHVVPGQEEGNIALIEQMGIGALASGSADHPYDILLGAIANNGALWHAWKKNLATLQKPSASRKIAQFLLDKASRSLALRM